LIYALETSILRHKLNKTWKDHNNKIQTLFYSDWFLESSAH